MRKCKRWTNEENKIIIENYEKIGTGIKKILPGRTKDSIRMQAQKLGIKKIVESEREPFQDSFGHWLAGLIDGEGSFSVYYNKNDKGPKFYPQFSLGLKFSDIVKELLETVQKKIGGKIYIQSKNSVPKSITIRIINIKDCIFLRKLLRKYKLKIKENDFKTWSEIINAKLDKNKNNFETLKNLTMKLNTNKGPKRIFYS
ncbi:MAG: hypothetical protein GTN36_03845 [Candidatus Aenigmarchaeota archaeon]|nr:hypothetical protein [Candidatus Aenigmarchaeota archaeon]